MKIRVLVMGRLTIVLATIGGFGCGDATAPGAWLQPGTPITLVAEFLTEYDCAPTLTPEIDEDICQGRQGLVRVGEDSLYAVGMLAGGEPAIFGSEWTAEMTGELRRCALDYVTGAVAECAVLPVASTAQLGLVNRCYDRPIGECPVTNESVLLVTMDMDFTYGGFFLTIMLRGAGELNATGAAGGAFPGLEEWGNPFLPTRFRGSMHFSIQSYT